MGIPLLDAFHTGNAKTLECLAIRKSETDGLEFKGKFHKAKGKQPRLVTLGEHSAQVPRVSPPAAV